MEALSVMTGLGFRVMRAEIEDGVSHFLMLSISAQICAGHDPPSPIWADFWSRSLPNTAWQLAERRATDPEYRARRNRIETAYKKRAAAKRRAQRQAEIDAFWGRRIPTLGEMFAAGAGSITLRDGIERGSRPS